MATLASVICLSHSPYLFQPPELWTSAQAKRAAAGGFREPVVIETLEANAAKHARCIAAMDELKARLAADRPDGMVIFGDDQSEQFRFSNFPAFALYTGARFAGYRVSRWEGIPLPDGRRAERPKTPEHWAEASNRPDLARHLLAGLVGRGFDLAFSTELPDPEEGIGHAFMRPSAHFDPEYALPIVPVLLNCFYGPQPTGWRCHELGRTAAELIEDWPVDARVTVIGSGGLWHTPMMPRSYVDETFDLSVLGFVERGDSEGLAEFFDTYPQPFDLSTEQGLALASGGTGVVTGLGSGTGETRNWIAAVAAAGRARGEIIDYVQIGASPIGVAFAHFKLN